MIGRAAALTNLGDKDRAFRAKKQAFGSFFRFSPCRCALMRRKLRQRQIPSFGRRMVRVCRETDFSGCCFAWKYDGMGTSEKKPPFVTRVASRAHPLAECRGAATEAAHSAGKGRFGGNVETRISPAVVSPGNTTAWGCREKPPFVTRVASRAHPLAGCRGAATEAAHSAGKGRFGGNVETRISPAVVSPGNTTAWGRRKKASLCHPCRQPSAPACGVPRRRNGSRAQLRQRQVRRECRNEDFSGCYFARKYNCMGTPEKSHCSRILFSKKRR